MGKWRVEGPFGRCGGNVVVGEEKSLEWRLAPLVSNARFHPTYGVPIQA